MSRGVVVTPPTEASPLGAPNRRRRNSSNDVESGGFVISDCVLGSRSRPLFNVSWCDRNCNFNSSWADCRADATVARLRQCLSESTHSDGGEVAMMPLRSMALYGTLFGLLLASHPSTVDAVSNQIRVSGAWEFDELSVIDRVLLRIRHDVRSVATHLLRTLSPSGGGHGGQAPGGEATADAGALLATIGHQDGVELVDIGMNIGSLSFPVWWSGFSVRGFEAMPGNVQLLRMTECVNRNASKPRLVITHCGLTSWHQDGHRCDIVSGVTNVGDGMLRCPPYPLLPGEAIRGQVTLRALDLVIDHNEEERSPPALFRVLSQRFNERQLSQVSNGSSVGDVVPSSSSSSSVASLAAAPVIPWAGLSRESDVHERLTFLHNKHRVVKIDVEGEELNVVRGAPRFLSGPDAPLFILTEVWDTLDSVGYARLMRRHGYRFRAPTVLGPWIWIDTDDEAAQWKAQQKGMVNAIFLRRGAEALLPDGR